MESVTRSPIYSHFGETLTGRTVPYVYDITSCNDVSVNRCIGHSSLWTATTIHGRIGKSHRHKSNLLLSKYHRQPLAVYSTGNDWQSYCFVCCTFCRHLERYAGSGSCWIIHQLCLKRNLFLLVPFGPYRKEWIFSFPDHSNFKLVHANDI